MPPRKGKRFHRRGRKAVVRRRKNNMDVREYASLTERVTQTDPGGGALQLNKLYSKLNYQLNDYVRASTVARAYQYYRITGITLTFKPNLDTFAIGSGQTKPYLYYLIDKTGSVPSNISLEGMKKMGAKPIVFDEKTITIKWRPSVLGSTQDNTLSSTPAKPMISPWLSTVKSPGTPGPVTVFSDVDHLGIYFYVWCAGSGGSDFYVDATLNFEFKKPVWALDTSATPAATIVNAKIDDSSDGIVDNIA